MVKNIKINQNEVKENAEAISKVAEYLNGEKLSTKDDNTTITANGKGKEVYEKSQNLLTTLGQAIDQEAINIRSLGITFKEYDEMMTKLQKSQSQLVGLTSIR